jgi:vacuolar-type H+-ATPase subunit F/Vma7
MTNVVALGEADRVMGYALAGAAVIEATGAASVRAAWDDLPAGTVLVILTPAAHEALQGRIGEGTALVAVLP